MKCGWCGNSHVGTCPCTGDTLTFAEAMALDPSEVEIHWNSPDDWRHLDGEDARKAPHWVIRQAKFRRSRPKRSRVEEMALEFSAPGIPYYAAAVGKVEAIIRAVCEYLRDLKTGGSTGPNFAHEIERHFLVPR